MGRRSDIDWEAIERDYRIGQLSLREICRIHGIAMSGLTKKAKDNGWKRDATKAVAVAVKTAIVTERANFAEELARQAPEIGREIGTQIAKAAATGLSGEVAAAAALGTIRNRIHADIADAGLRAATDMLAEIRALNDQEFKEGLRVFLLERSDPNDADAAKTIDKMVAKLFALPERARSLDTILAAAAKGVAIDRKANGLDEEKAKTEGTMDEFYKQVDELVRSRKGQG